MAITLSLLSPRPSPAGGAALAVVLVVACVVDVADRAAVELVVEDAPVRPTFFGDECVHAPRRHATAMTTPTRRNTAQVCSLVLMEPVVDPPRWDVSDVFPSLESREFAAAQEAIGADLLRLVGLYDRHDVRGGEPRQPTKEDLAAFDEVTKSTNDFLEQTRILQAYVHAFITTDARDDKA